MFESENLSNFFPWNDSQDTTNSSRRTHSINGELTVIVKEDRDKEPNPSADFALELLVIGNNILFLPNYNIQLTHFFVYLTPLLRFYIHEAS